MLDCSRIAISNTVDFFCLHSAYGKIVVVQFRLIDVMANEYGNKCTELNVAFEKVLLRIVRSNKGSAARTQTCEAHTKKRSRMPNDFRGNETA